jgi:hypothetical protein
MNMMGITTTKEQKKMTMEKACFKTMKCKCDVIMQP